MSLNQVNSSGELERVAGLVNSEKINEMYEAFPSDASASNKLVTHQTPYESFTLNNNSGSQKWYKLGTYMSGNNTARLDFVSARVDGQMFESSVRISGIGADANYISWIGENGSEISIFAIKVDTNRNLYVQINSYSAIEIRVYGVFTLDIAEQSSAPSGAGIPLQKLVTDGDIFKIGDRRNVIGWADLSDSVTIDGSSNYANNIGRIEGHNAIIQVSNPTTVRQWPVTNSGDNNNFMDFGGAIQFFTDKVNDNLYVRYSNSTDMSSWEKITAIKSGTITDTVNSNGYLNTTLQRSVNVISVISQNNSQTARFVISDDGLKYAIQILNGTSNTPITSGTATVIYYYI